MEEEILSNHRQILQRIRDYSTEMPREVVGLINLPCGGPIKCHWSHCGTLEEGKREFEENMKIPFTPTVNTLGPVSYQLGVQLLAVGPNKAEQQAGNYFQKGHLLEDLSSECIEEILNFQIDSPGGGVRATFLLFTIGGAILDLPNESTAVQIWDV
eukprot:TRINITY_DN16391_c0_g1_i2.p1 TRINITY_DN16391_c0_g1~~TRINITY_DN16391_c0_g1_i2.p1  ORF type:complete len:156 (+),score=27.91 TRINITY_DN16391_c0_g1_i2:232-699(+)